MNKLIRCFFVSLLLGATSGFAHAEAPSSETIASSPNPTLPSESPIAPSVTPLVAGADFSEKRVSSASQKPAPAIPKETLFWLYGILFLGVGFLAYKFWKKGALVRSNSRQSKLQVLEMRVLGNKQFLLVVEYDKQRMLLGVSPGIIQHICVLGEDYRSTNAPPSADFSELLGSGHTFTAKAPPSRDPVHSK